MRSGTCPRTYGEPMSTDYPSSDISSNPLLSALPRYASVFLSQGSDLKLPFPIWHMPLKTSCRWPRQGESLAGRKGYHALYFQGEVLDCMFALLWARERPETTEWFSEWKTLEKEQALLRGVYVGENQS